MNDLLRKLTWREQRENIRQVWKLQRRLDARYFPLACLLHLMDALLPYAGLFLSAYILDALVQGQSIMPMLSVVLPVLAGTYGISLVRSSLQAHLMVRERTIGDQYEYLREEKMLTLDFAQVDSPLIRQMRTQMAKDQNWGMGWRSVIWCGNFMIRSVLNLVSAALLGTSALGALLTARSIALWALLVLIALLVTACVCAMLHYFTLMNRFMYQEPGEDEINFCWDFAQGHGFTYENGKDARIYESYDLLQKWTVTAWHNPSYRYRMVHEGAAGLGGSSLFEQLMTGALEGASYILIALLALGGYLSLGMVVSMAGCLRNFFVGAAQVANAMSQLSNCAHQQMSVLRFLELHTSMYQGKLPLEKRRDNRYQIEFRNVSFRYPGSEKYALRHVSLRFTIGEKLAIVGQNGSGKTTLIKLLCRLYDPDEGEILLGGVDIRKFKHEEYSRLFAVVFQDFSIFPFKLGETIAASTQYDGAEVKRCLHDAGLGNRLETLGLDSYLYTQYDEKGIQISGGEAQKIALARAMYKKSPFVLLDEPTAALDPISEYEVYTGFNRIAGGRTAIYISHRLSSCRFCDQIAVFHEGSLVQLGSHEALMADPQGKYYTLWNAQAQYYQKHYKQ